MPGHITTTSSGIYPAGGRNLSTFQPHLLTTSIQYSLGKSTYVWLVILQNCYAVYFRYLFM